MATDNHQSHQDENAIDNLNHHLTSTGQKLAENKKYIFWGIGVILAVGCFVIGYFAIYRNPRLNNAWEAYDKVEINAMGNDSTAAAQYAQVADKYSSTDAGKVAALAAAEALYNTGNYEEAAKYLKKFSTKDDVLEANANVLLGDCYVNLKKYDEAIAAFQKAVRTANSNPQIVPRVLMKEAVVYDELKKYDEALKCYEMIKKDFPRFTLGNGVSIDAYIEREKARLGK